MSYFQNGKYSNIANGTAMNILYKIIFIILLAVFSLPIETTVAHVEPVVEVEDKIEILIDAIEEMEGNYAGTIATRNNNPCNLRWGINQAGKKNGFSYFKSYEIGRNACRHQIEISADGRSRVYNPEMTLLEFFNKYAPASDDNQPSIYYEFVIKKTGFSEDIKLKDLLL